MQDCDELSAVLVPTNMTPTESALFWAHADPIRKCLYESFIGNKKVITKDDAEFLIDYLYPVFQGKITPDGTRLVRLNWKQIVGQMNVDREALATT